MFSIIIATYNRSALLHETIDSILNQTYKEFEIIVVSDGSTDDTKERIEAIDDDRINFIQLDRNYGFPAVARNVGIINSNFPYIAFCDDDDLWLPDKLMKQSKFIANGYDMIFSNFNLLDHSNNSSSLYRHSILPFLVNRLSSKISFYYLCFTNPIAHSSVVISKKVLGENRFIESLDYRASEDYELWIKVFKKSNPFYIKEALFEYRVHEDNISSDFLKNLKRCIMIFRNLKKQPYPFKYLGVISYYLRFYICNIKNLITSKR